MLVERQEALRRALPEWTCTPLQLASMSGSEIRELMTRLSEVERQSGLDEIEGELDTLDASIESIENELIAAPACSLEAVSVLLEIAIDQLREKAHEQEDHEIFEHAIRALGSDVGGYTVAASGNRAADRARRAQNLLVFAASEGGE